MERSAGIDQVAVGARAMTLILAATGVRCQSFGRVTRVSADLTRTKTV